MESIFSRDPAPRVPSIFDQIAPELEHLDRGGRSAREGDRTKSKAGAWATSIALCFLLALFFMDPFLYALHKSAAIRAYVYLHNHASESATHALVASGIFSKGEIAAMNERPGPYQDYFTSPSDAEERASSVIDFMKGTRDLRHGQYSELDPVGKLRYLLFVRMGLTPPVTWKGLNPSVY